MFLFIFLGFFIFNAAEEKLTTTTEGEVCDLDSSCNSSFTTELPIEKSNISKKLKYNISDGIIYNNETLDIFSLNGTNLTTVELDLRNKNNKSVGNESKFTNTKYRIQIKERCSCDLTKGSCDINCCCDRDCLVVNRDIFKKCIKTTHTEVDKMCISKILNSPLLCVVKDNLYSRHFYPQHQTAVEASYVDKLMKNREVYGWSYPFLSENEHIFHNFKEYELNSFVWIFKDADTKTFRLPKTTMISRDCSNTEAMKFLNDFEDTCIYRIREISITECESNSSIFNALTYFSNFSFVMNPNFFNNSNDCRNHCINVIPFICASDDFASCVKANVSKIIPIYFSNTSTCYQAVTSVHYEIFHNGTEGILSVNVYLQFANITFHSELLWAVSFKLTYKWANQNEAFELSGYPGYIAEKPIITSYKTFQNSKENKTYASLKMSHNHKNWLTIFRTNNDGSCAKMRRKNILFQENLYAHCWISVPEIKSAENCESFQNEIFEIMFGVNFNLSNIYVSTYGDPDLGDKLKWAPITMDFPSNVMNESCYGIITSIKMIILYSAIGEHDNPQQVIMGLKVSGTSLYRNVVKYHRVLITFGVNFYDVTNPPLRIFAEPPTYEVKLPTDFFYPFFSKCSPVLGSKTILSVLMFFLYSFY